MKGPEKIARFEADWHDGYAVVPIGDDVLSRAQVATVLADQYHNKRAGVPPEKLSDKWIISKSFKLMRLPIWAISPYRYVEPGDRTYSDGPVIVDGNKSNFNKHFGPFGSSLDYMILDGKHRYWEALRAGKTHIEAWVGNFVARSLAEYLAVFGPARERFAASLRSYYDDPSPRHHAAVIKTCSDVFLNEKQSNELIAMYRDGFEFDVRTGQFTHAGNLATA